MADELFIKSFDPESELNEFIALDLQTTWNNIYGGQGKPTENFLALYEEFMNNHDPSEEDSLVRVAVTKSGEYCGHLWSVLTRGPFEEDLQPFIMDFTMKEERRNYYAAKALLIDTVQIWQSLGFKKLDATVFAINDKVRKMAEREGFGVTSYNISLDITPKESKDGEQEQGKKEESVAKYKGQTTVVKKPRTKKRRTTSKKKSSKKKTKR